MEATWLNGAFGVGKSSVGGLVADRCPSWLVFDPEPLGGELMAGIASRVADFQDLPGWRQIVPGRAAELATEASRPLLVVQTVLRRDYWEELTRGMSERGFDLRQIVLECDDGVLRQRIQRDGLDERATQWRLAHIDDYRQARRSWLLEAADLVIDTSNLTTRQVADRVATALGGKPLT